MNKSLQLFVLTALHLALLWLWVAALDSRHGTLPPLGKFLSPFEGFWRNAEPDGPERGKGEEVELPGLNSTVVAEYDHRGVPHLFAPDLHSLFFAQGYVTARDRLWQMDIQSRAGMGRLSEIMGPSLVRFDQERRRMGMPEAAAASLERMLADSLTRVALEAYTEGVNAWITNLKPATYPLEFKLLDYAPELWTPLKSAVLIKNLQWTLSQSVDDTRLSHVLDSLGSGFFSRYYPARHPGAEPVFPQEVYPGVDSTHVGSREADRGAGREAGRGIAQANALSETPGILPSGPVAGAALQSPSITSTGLKAWSDSLWPRPNRASGSNNFVLAGTRTRTGYPILANDPHLDLTLPSLWYETQLKSGPVNAYGVSLPGLPGIVIGFTESTAWGLTNGMDDVYDWVAPQFRNDSLNQYLWRGRWRTVRRVIDTILVRGSEPVVDTQLWTHLGPVPVLRGEAPFGPNTPPLHALQWTALHPSNEPAAFLRMMSVKSVSDLARMSRFLETPTQNVAFVTRRDIALFHQGRIPEKRAGQGRLLARGTSASTYNSSYSSEWRAYIPASELPFAINPARGWLGSANQEATNEKYPWYLGSDFYPPERSQRLNRLLVNEQDATLSSAWNILLDDYSRLAARALPLLLRHLPAHDSTATDTARAATNQHSADLLRAWDYRYAAGAQAPVLFDLWWAEFYRMVWIDDLRGDFDAYVRPSRAVTLALLAGDTLDEAFDDIRTQTVESAGDLARTAFAHALQKARRAGAGKPNPFSWGNAEVGEIPVWGRYRPLSIPHVLGLAPLGVSGLSADGCGECLNAQRGSHGPSWRMVVQTGKRPEAWGIYPGGQTGNPGSSRYDAFVKDWAAGRAYRLLFLNWPLEVPDSTGYILALKGKR